MVRVVGKEGALGAWVGGNFSSGMDGSKNTLYIWTNSKMSRRVSPVELHAAFMHVNFVHIQTDFWPLNSGHHAIKYARTTKAEGRVFIEDLPLMAPVFSVC